VEGPPPYPLWRGKLVGDGREGARRRRNWIYMWINLESLTREAKKPLE
jgi:hypothetical protein